MISNTFYTQPLKLHIYHNMNKESTGTSSVNECEIYFLLLLQSNLKSYQQ